MTVFNSFRPRILVAIPAYGRDDLVQNLLTDLAREKSLITETFVIDNRGKFETESKDVTVVRPGRNLRWIGATNLALRFAERKMFDICIVLNSDIRLSLSFVRSICKDISSCPKVALVAPCYDDFWPHQRAYSMPKLAYDYVPRETTRDVLFCDGTALAFSMRAVRELGVLDQGAFGWHGYGADIDYSIRVRTAGFRVLVTERAFVSHLRRASMDEEGLDESLALDEINSGLTAKYGKDWREIAGLSELALTEAHTGNGVNWYL